MKTQFYSGSSLITKHQDYRDPAKGNKKNEKGGGISLSTFSLTDLVNEVLGTINGSYLRIQVMEAEMVVTRSDRELLIQALSQCLNELISYSGDIGHYTIMTIRIYKRSGIGYIEVECPDLDLGELSLRTGKNALTLTGHVEPAFGFLVAQAVLAKVKSLLHINHNRRGGSTMVFEIPKVRGQAS